MYSTEKSKTEPASLQEGHPYDDPRKYWFSIYMKFCADLIASIYAF